MLQARLDAAPAYTEIQLLLGIYRYTSLAWNKDGVVLVGTSTNTSDNDPGTVLQAIGTPGAYGIKIGDAATNYPSAMKRGPGFRRLLLEFSGKKYSDSALVVEGIQSLVLDDVSIWGVGATGAGNGCMAARFKVVWDSVFLRFNMQECMNFGGNLFYFDQTYIDADGNNNKLTFISPHIEANDGTLFASHASGNLDVLMFRDPTIERGDRTSTGNWVFDFAQGIRVQVRGGAISTFDSAHNAGIVRHSAGWGLIVKDVQMAGCSGNFVTLGASSSYATIADNYQDGATPMSFVNNSIWPVNFEYPVSVGGTDQIFGRGFAQTGRNLSRMNGWRSVHEYTNSPDSLYVPDIATANIQRSVARRTDTTAQGAILLTFPLKQFSDFPVDVTCYVKCRRTADGATASLQVNVNGNTVAGTAFAALPAAVATISFDGDGTTVTATKAAHGFKVGDRILVTLTTNYNTAAGSPVQILTVPDANTFTYASAVNQASESGSGQKCQWQVISFTLTSATHFPGIGEDSTDRFRLEYGAGNTQFIDLDAVSFRY
jgi:hypothetical protein